MELREARKLIAQKLREEAMENGLNSVWSHVREYEALYQQLSSPGETVIVFLARRRKETTLLEGESGASTTAFVATDRSFMFLEPERRRFLGSGVQRSVARRIPFEEVKSVTVDVAGAQLVIRFERGAAWVDLRRLGRDWYIADCHGVAERLVHHFKPFLPLRLQQGW